MDPQTLHDKLYKRPKHPIILSSESPVHRSSSQMSLASSESSNPFESNSLTESKRKLYKKDHWMKDEDATECCYCRTKFTMMHRKHHCRKCGMIYCSKCSNHRVKLDEEGNMDPVNGISVRICISCFEEVESQLYSDSVDLHSTNESQEKDKQVQPSSNTTTSALKDNWHWSTF